MSDADRRLWADKCRERSPTSLCDSGGAYGYAWQRPAIDPDLEPDVDWEAPDRYDRRDGVSLSWNTPTLSTSWYLSQWLDVDEDLNRQWETWLEEHEDSDLPYHKELLLFMRSLNPDNAELMAGNTYNEDNCLSQDFWYRVYGPDDCSRDACYSDDALIVVVSVHTGCDVCSGYARPVLCRSATDYTVPIDLCPGFYIAEARRPRRVKYRQPAELFAYHGIPDTAFTEGPDRLTRDECQALDEEWRSGYSHYPMSQFEKDVVRAWIWTYNPKEKTICVMLKNGIIACVGVETPYLG